MKKILNEKNSLPLTFKYIDLKIKRTDKKTDKDIQHFVKCNSSQTNFFTKEKPIKSLTRML